MHNNIKPGKYGALDPVGLEVDHKHIIYCCILYSLHYTIYTYCTVYTIQYIHTVQYTLNNIYILYSIH